MNPQYREKKPIRRSRYRILASEFSIEPVLKDLRQRTKAKTIRIAPWKTSPNMTPKRKGKVTAANTAGLISL